MAEKHDEDFEKAAADMARDTEARMEPEEEHIFGRGLRALNKASVAYMIGGAFAKHAYTCVWRNTKDLDIFLKPEDLKLALDTLAGVGFETEIEFKHWLAKARQDPYFIDLIFGTGHGQLTIDGSWFAHSRPIELAGVQSHLIPPEELLVSKVYVAERYRFDGADVLHLIERTQGQLDWQRILNLLEDNRQLLLVYLILFDFVYPGRSEYLPRDLMRQLFEEVGRPESQDNHAFRGTLLDPFSYVVDIEDWGYEDRRNLEPLVNDRGEEV